jgi:hypothetical protein
MARWEPAAAATRSCVAQPPPARLDPLDVGRRVVALREVGTLRIGQHAVNIAQGTRLAPGV